MAGGGRQRSSPFPDPDRRACLRSIRAIRMQVLEEHEKDLAEIGFFGRVLLRLRSEMEIRSRFRDPLLEPHE